MPVIYLLFFLLALFPVERAMSATLALGLDSHGRGHVEVVDPTHFSNQAWPNVGWGKYNTDNGETRPAWCDVDGDGKHELVTGLGQGGGGWLQIRDDADTGYTHLAWVRVPWGNYNTSNGETFPACGDLDGDKKDEIVIGLGNGGKGWVLVLEDADAGYSVKRWLQVNWSSYNSKNGTVHPAVGNVDDDADAEIVFGLGSDGAGWLQILDDAGHGFTSLKWVRENWKNYNTANGETRPVLCDVDGDGQNELVIGLGKGGLGYLKVLDDVASGSASLGWPQIPWSTYNSSNGETYPTCGDVDGDGRDELLVGLGNGGNGYYNILDDHAAGFESVGWNRVHWGSYNNSGGLVRPVLSPVISKSSDIEDSFTNSLGMAFKLIPSGTFMMGCEGEDGSSGYSCFSDEAPKHEVTISQAFYMQTTEVTQGQWKAVMGSNPSYYSSCGDSCPVERVSWDDAQTFLSILNDLGQETYRMPTEAEWEYSARAGTTKAWSSGDSESQLGDYAWYGDNSLGTHPVASKLPNPWGLHDINGNVSEWVQDTYSSLAYGSHSESDPVY